MSRFIRFGLNRRLALVTGAATAGGSGLLLYSNFSSPRAHGLDSSATLSQLYSADGTFHLPKFPRIKSRDEQIADLKISSSAVDGEQYDVLVIGCGATGAGVALDAATRGLKVAVIERDDFSSGTSSKSTKLVHGGFRYLEKAVWNLDYAQYELVKEALKERKSFLESAPHLSEPLPIMLAIDSWWKVPYYWAGTKCYDLLAGSKGLESSYFLTKNQAVEAYPMLKPSTLKGALVFYDGTHNDSRTNVSIALTAALYGATVVNHMEVTQLTKGADGKLNGAKLRDMAALRDGKTPADIEVKAKCIINCTGPFTDGIRKQDDSNCKEIVAPASGVHIVLPGYYSPKNMGLIDPSSSDGRVLFALPWQGNTIVGTTDSPTKITKDPLPDEESIQWILSELRKCLAPDVPLRREDVLAAWSGIRPLVKDPKAKNTESLVRNHLIDISPSGLITCAGGKWTTFRQMAEECVDTAIEEFGLQTKPWLQSQSTATVENTKNSIMGDDATFLDGSCRTENLKLVGGHGFSHTLFIHLIQQFKLDTDVAKHLASSYGDRAWAVASLCSEVPAGESEKPSSDEATKGLERISTHYPFLSGEVRYAARSEYAQTAVDFLARRTRLSFLDAQASLKALPKIIDIMSEELKWDEPRKEVEWKQTVAFLESMGLPQSMLALTRKEVEQWDIKHQNVPTVVKPRKQILETPEVFKPQEI
ncbi:glycerol-3-phosphate dehydrogenase [Xylariales sp. PMI_506]|nr:glycerol-3-phosphate dehydrogenase [Xylariales sp. PMI_506]